MTAATEAPAAYRQRVEVELAPFSPTLNDIDAMVAAQGDIPASAVIMHVLLARAEAEFAQQGGVFQ